MADKSQSLGMLQLTGNSANELATTVNETRESENSDLAKASLFNGSLDWLNWLNWLDCQRSTF